MSTATAAAAVAAVRRASKTPSTRWQVRTAQVRLATGTVTVPSNPVQPERHFWCTCFVATWSRELPTDPFFGPIFKGEAATVGGAVDCRGHPVAPATQHPAGGAFIIRCCFFTAEGRGKRAGCMCLAGGVEGPHPAGVARHPARLALRPPQDGRPRPSAPSARLLAEANARRRRLRSVLRGLPAHQGQPRWPALLQPLPLPSQRGGVIGVDWLLASGFDQVQAQVDLLACKVHAVPTHATDTAPDAAWIILDGPRDGAPLQ